MKGTCVDAAFQKTFFCDLFHGHVHVFVVETNCIFSAEIQVVCNIAVKKELQNSLC